MSGNSNILLKIYLIACISSTLLNGNRTANIYVKILLNLCALCKVHAVSKHKALTIMSLTSLLHSHYRTLLL